MKQRVMMELNADLRRALPGEDTFDWLLNLEGQVHRQVKHRRTVEFRAGDRRYFIKIHRGCGWGEIFKDLLSGRLPIVSARSEWEGIECLRNQGIPTMTVAGKGLRGRLPSSLESFVITEALEHMISLEDLTKDWRGADGATRIRLKRALIAEMARMARGMHDAGLNHRDFYLCHFLVADRDWGGWKPGDRLELHLIDLHRVQKRARVPTRWQVKDLAALVCSAFDWGVTLRDVARFIGVYQGKPWSACSEEERRFWQRVGRRAHSLFAGFYKRQPPKSWMRSES